ncbi:Uu.00g042470.m01.CDS01 [Anthostomella pinea]|uniref:Uu.00g042470.m01.CDS01 n=1 Tax=Anthostomella pinea TaxID=933095 RepID=A0AAI8VAJ6_9PEZI|nr:Uu.00g042470.m01.CDS01 [Anthostomella pinea]
MPGSSSSSSSDSEGSYTTRMLARAKHEKQKLEETARSSFPSLSRFLKDEPPSSSTGSLSLTHSNTNGDDAGSTDIVQRSLLAPSAKPSSWPVRSSSLAPMLRRNPEDAPHTTDYGTIDPKEPRTCAGRLRELWSSIPICCGRKSDEGPD